MPKQIKGNPRRKQPEPAPDHSEIDEWLDTLMPSIQPVVRELDASICATLPGAQFGVKYRRAFYGVPEHGWVIEVAPYFVSVNALFFGGADFAPPPPLGETGRTRYVKLATADEARAPALLDWIRQAANVPGWA